MESGKRVKEGYLRIMLLGPFITVQKLKDLRIMQQYFLENPDVRLALLQSSYSFIMFSQVYN